MRFHLSCTVPRSGQTSQKQLCLQLDPGYAGTHDVLRVLLRADMPVPSKPRTNKSGRFTMLIPFTHSFVPVVDLGRRVMEISPPTGLLDLVSPYAPRAAGPSSPPAPRPKPRNLAGRAGGRGVPIDGGQAGRDVQPSVFAHEEPEVVAAGYAPRPEGYGTSADQAGGAGKRSSLGSPQEARAKVSRPEDRPADVQQTNRLGSGLISRANDPVLAEADDDVWAAEMLRRATHISSIELTDSDLQGVGSDVEDDGAVSTAGGNQGSSARRDSDLNKPPALGGRGRTRRKRPVGLSPIIR